MLDATAISVIPSEQQAVGLACDFAPTPSGCRRWYVVASYPKAERRAHAALHLKGYEPYLPLVTTRTPKREYRTAALFPGYLFIRLDISRPWYPIRYAPGVFHLLTVDGIPNPCPDGAVEALQAAQDARREVAAENARPPVGAIVAVANGVLQNCHGIVIAADGAEATISTIMFGQLRQITVPIDRLILRSE